jgi:hypothetical protein
MSQQSGKKAFVLLLVGLSAYGSLRLVAHVAHRNADPTDYLGAVKFYFFAAVAFLFGGAAVLIAQRSRPPLPQAFVMTSLLATLFLFLLLGLAVIFHLA